MLAETFKKPKPILGKIQLLPLPGAPGWDGQWESLVARAEQEATALATGGVDGLIIENTHDTPYSQARMDAAGAIAMALITRRLQQFTGLPVGVSVLQNDPETALAVVINTDAAFIRLPLLTGALVTAGGIVNSRFNALLHYQQQLKTDLPPMLVDLSINHLGPAANMRLPVGETGGERLNHLIRLGKSLPHQAGGYAVILSDHDITPEEIIAFRDMTGMPVLIENQGGNRQVEAYFEQADGLVLDADIRKSTAAQASLPPTIDMPRVEELVNTLRKVVPLSEMDPDIFLSR